MNASNVKWFNIQKCTTHFVFNIALIVSLFAVIKCHSQIKVWGTLPGKVTTRLQRGQCLFCRFVHLIFLEALTVQLTEVGSDTSPKLIFLHSVPSSIFSDTSFIFLSSLLVHSGIWVVCVYGVCVWVCVASVEKECKARRAVCKLTVLFFREVMQRLLGEW